MRDKNIENILFKNSLSYIHLYRKDVNMSNDFTVILRDLVLHIGW